MSLFDWVFPLVLIQSVVRRLRGKHLSTFALAWPLAIVIWAALSYVHGFPAQVADLALVIGCGVAGGLFGTFAGTTTSVYRRSDGRLMARATGATVAYWTVGTIGRLVFGLYPTSGGGPAIERFSAAHGLSLDTWASALTLMALAEVVGRTAVLIPRALHHRPGATGADLPAADLPAAGREPSRKPLDREGRPTAGSRAPTESPTPRSVSHVHEEPATGQPSWRLRTKVRVDRNRIRYRAHFITLSRHGRPRPSSRSADADQYARPGLPSASRWQGAPCRHRLRW